MALPTYQELMLPLLRVLGSAQHEMHQKECTRLVSDALGIPEADREVTLPSGGQTTVHNRIGWAGWYMQQAGLVEKTKRAHLRITSEGQKVLALKLAEIDNKY